MLLAKPFTVPPALSDNWIPPKTLDELKQELVGSPHPDELFPADALTMIGMEGAENLHWCAEQVLREGIPGDFVETGVWRGGACLLMRAILQAYGNPDKRVWVCDSFQGVPPIDAVRYPKELTYTGLSLDRFGILAVPFEQVVALFARYGLLDDRVCFVPGWFRDTLPTLPVEQISLLRLDGDLYESTILALDHLYPKLSVGGYVIVDDYAAIACCHNAVTDYRQAHKIETEIQMAGPYLGYWKKAGVSQ